MITTAAYAAVPARSLLAPYSIARRDPGPHEVLIDKCIIKRSLTMAEHYAIVGIFNTHTEAETSIKELQLAGFDMKKLSIVGKDYHPEEHVVGYYNAGDRTKVRGKQGAFWRSLSRELSPLSRLLRRLFNSRIA